MKSKIALVSIVPLVLAAACSAPTAPPPSAPVAPSSVAQPALAPGVVAIAPSDAGSELAANNKAVLQAAVDRDNKHLPKPYTDGLNVEHEQVEGNRLVIVIRIPDVGLDSLKKEMLATMQRQEQGDLFALACKDEQLHSLLDRKAEVSHRFLDKDGKLIFEVVAMPSDCGKAM